MGFGDFAAPTQFFLYGKKHFTQTGYKAHAAKYAEPNLLHEVNLEGKVFCVTGANSGIGKEMVTALAGRGAEVYLICRNPARAEKARAEVAEKTGSKKLHVLVADCGLEKDVRQVWVNFAAHRTSTGSETRLDGLICNAGALLNEKTFTGEGIEVTFASHFLFGTYLLGSLAMPLLKATGNARLIVVSSGGMYNTRFPDWATATSTGSGKYDGTLAYAYAKRGQVLLCERWATANPDIKIVSSHPGWTDTPGVEEAFGDDAKYLKPLRTQAEGSEGIVWLCAVAPEKIQPGAFYLDREPQVKHMAGPFFTEGSATKNTVQQVDGMMVDLENWANGRQSLPPRGMPLKAMDRLIELERFMGRWYVLANIPTYFDKGTINNTEDYVWDDKKKTIEVAFSYQKSKTAKTDVVQQRCTVANDSKTEWALSPKIGLFYIPLGIPYLILDCAEDYSTCIVGVPDRSYIWIMTRTKGDVVKSVKEGLMKRAEEFGYNTRNIVTVPQEWD